MRLIKIFENKIIIFILVIIIQFPLTAFAQNNEAPFSRDTLISLAREMMETARYCALITLDETGYPAARTMDPFVPDDNMVVWLGTNLNSKKVVDIKKDSRVSLYYQSPKGTGYVLIKGQAQLVNNTMKKQIYWKKEWSRYYSEDKSNYILIKVIPDNLKLLDYQHGIVGDTKTWDVPFVEFKHIK